MAQGEILQDDFSAGIVRSVARHLIPGNGAYDMIDLLLDDDGSAYKRAGAEYLSGAAFGATGVRWVWDGQLAPGARTVLANSADYGVLSSDDATVVNLGGAGLAGPVRATAIGGMLFIDGGVIYGGSRKTADYSTGTVSVTNGSKTVTGAGTSWSANVDAGMLLRVAGAGRYYAVASVDSNTQVTLYDAYRGSTAATQAYALTMLGSASNSPYRSSSVYGVAGNRLLSGEGANLYASGTVTSVTTEPDGPHQWATEDYVTLPGGAQILGIDRVRDQSLLFTTEGMWVVYGLAVDQTDQGGNPQWRLEEANRDLVLWSKEGIATWRGQMIVPAVDGVWLVDSVNASQKLSTSITPLYVDYVRAGYKTGLAAVHRGHYFLPILDSSNAAVDLLVCRLDRPTQTRVGVIFPWTRFSGYGGNTVALTNRVGTATRQPLLLAAGRGTGSRVNKLNAFEPTAARKQDADATNFTWQLTTRDYTLNGEYEGLVRKILLRYEMIDAASDNPRISGYYSTGLEQAVGSEWGTAEWGVDDWSDASLAEFTLLEGTAPEDDGRDPFPWSVVAKARFLRARFQSSDPAASSVARSIRLLLDPMLKQR